MSRLGISSPASVWTDKFTIQENATRECLFFDSTQKDGAGDWTLRAAPCDPTAANLDPKFLWSYKMVPDANLDAQRWYGLENQGRVLDLPGGWNGTPYQWDGEYIRGYHTQTTDPDQRIQWARLASDREYSSVATDGGALTKVRTIVDRFWTFNQGTHHVEIKTLTREPGQFFTVKNWVPPLNGDYTATNVGARGGTAGGVRAIQADEEGQAPQLDGELPDGLFEAGACGAAEHAAEDELLLADASEPFEWGL